MKHHLRFLILRYLPNLVGNDSVPIAVLVHEVDTGSYVETRFLKTWEHILRFDKNADLEALEALKKEIESDWPDPRRRQSLVTMFLGTFSNTLQVEETSCSTDTPAAEMDAVSALYLSPHNTA